jgi:hypothetical protein
MCENKSTFQFFWEDRMVANQFRSGVSLHSHTMYSEENLDVLQRHVGKVPILSSLLPKHVDYERAFWTPPLSPRRAYRLEEKQIQRQLNLPALVSLTDHDGIRAGILLRVMERYKEAPISVEWTIPFGRTFFHIGVHNLPAANAIEIQKQLKRVTAQPDIESLRDTLSFLHSHPDVLLVLNHPLWDEKGIGSEAHANELHQLLSQTTPYLHALELNGLRGWTENRNVVRIANDIGLPVVSGGDRHGCEPNAIVNLSEASSFPEFVDEIRTRRRSHVVFMPQYRQPLNWRTMQTVIDILRDYPSSFAGRRLWTERVFYRIPNGPPASLAALFPEGRVPYIFKAITSGVHLVQYPGIPRLLRFLMRAGGSESQSLDLHGRSNPSVTADSRLTA